jgi:predicted NAD-dependent protein-ADP-ribosyltransferase YbiA (DUF1768 family)
MVSSKLNPKINYIEKRTIESEDVGHTSILYIIDVYGVETMIVLGKPKYTFSGKQVVYYPIYVVADDKIKSQIGVYEAPIDNTINLVDEEGDIDLDKLSDPLFYTFVNRKYIEKSNTNPGKVLREQEIEKEVTQPEKKQSDKLVELPEESDDEDDAIKLKVPLKKISEEKQKADKIVEDGIFTSDPHFRQPALLTEELDADADKHKTEYKESSTTNWLEKFMKNNHYDIVENEGGGDCFFAVIRDAFEHIGQKTTVHKLRTLLSTQLTEEVFSENRKLYEEFETQKNEIKTSLKELVDANTVFAKRIGSVEQREEREKIIAETKKIKEMYEKKMKELKQTTKLQNMYIGYMKNIDTLEKYRAYILTSEYWADTWAISTLEMLLKIKIIILSEESYKHRGFDSVLNCGEVNRNLIHPDYRKKSDFEPRHYIMTSYSGNHYRLITYKKKHIFTFNEIPYDIKILIVNKCLEKNSGMYYLIQDFRNFKTRLGLDPDEGNPEEDDSDDDIHSHLYRRSAIFNFHSKSVDSTKPGKGTGESIDKERVSEFAVLSHIDNWRRKLDDTWSESPFTIDKHRWASVEHYMQGTKFKKGFPDFYLQFSLDNPSELSKDAALAKMVGDISKSKHKNLRPQNIKVDVDYHLGRDDVERELALKAKFEQNADLKQMLKATRDAVLKQFIRRKPAKMDMLLMKVRHEIK